ncbi:hypothetical protein [Glaciimonas sp. PCH181]|uniref:hypothetical protein n=1 Tax=Glaciimonas sp. PCH181 TaxID=2133943 RepID=UPI000D3D4129|nr:hypothetical protein [Glaciimonas sp. PCH181]PUA19553.1 hypothetical protein C7W93_06805 [Glaciimonas sp. PCH181]
MAVIRPEGAHGDDARAAELLTIQNGGMDVGTRPIPGLKPGKLATRCGDTFTFLSRAVTDLPAKTCKSLNRLKKLAQRSDLAAN